MGEKITLSLSGRDVHGKKVKKLRAQGMVPSVVYGQGFEPISVQAEQVIMEKMFRAAGHHHPVYLTIDGKNKIAMIKDADIDPVKNTLRHVSFHAVKQNEKVDAEVPIRLVGEGESAAERAGLVVLQTIEALEVVAFPMDLPDALELSIIDLSEPAQHVTVADITLPENVEFKHPEDVMELTVASVYEPSALQAANDAAGGDAEPEDEAEVESEHGEDTDQESQAEESRPGGKNQDEPKQSNVDAK